MINTEDNTVSATVTVGSGPDGVAITPDGLSAYVANGGSTVSVINTEDNTVSETVTVGSFPIGVAITPAGLFAYVTNSGSGTVSVIDTADNTVIATVTVGSDPAGVAITPAGLNPVIALLEVSGKCKKNIFLTESEIFTVINWSIPSNGALPTRYKISRDFILIAIISEGEKRLFTDHNLQKDKSYFYLIVAEDQTGTTIATGDLVITCN